MSRLFAYMGNDSDRVACALYPARSALSVPTTAGSAAVDSWGIGFYQGEVLLQRRPKAPSEVLDFYSVAKGLRTDAILGHARIGTVGTPKNENTHPFRFRSWMFAHHGTIPRFAEIRTDLLGDIPDFLARNIRGQTDSEVFFHLFLSNLQKVNKLDEGRTSTGNVQEALRATLRRIAELSGLDAWGTADCVAAVTNGRILVVSRHRAPLSVHRVQSISDCPVCRESQVHFGRQKKIEHEHLRTVLVVADAPAQATTGPGWQEVADDHFLAVDHDLRVEVTP